MTGIITLLVLFVLVIVSSILTKIFPKVPLPVMQIILGFVFSLSPLPSQLTFEPEIFLVVVIAPLLFWDGYNVSRRALWRYRKPIILMAVALVLVTIVGLGLALHVLIPIMPLALAVALGALLSPTDPVAVKSIVRGYRLPKGLLPILEGESLLNDAAGIVIFRIAIGVVVTSVFNPIFSLEEFLLMGIGGLVVGVLLGYVFVVLRLKLRQFGFEEVNSLVAIQLVTPFIIYLIGEALHLSGILTVVAAGIVHGIERDRIQQTTTKLIIIMNNVRFVISYILNGLVFVLLGFLLAPVFTELNMTGQFPVWQIIIFIVIISGILFLIRFLWVYMLYKPFISPHCNRRHVNSCRPMDGNFPRFKYSLIAALCGIHGTVTLATALSLPFTLGDGTPMPFRNTIIFIASGVIILSFVFAIVFLPLLVKKESLPPVEKMSLEEANQHVIKKAIEELLEEQTPYNQMSINLAVKSLEERLVVLEQGLGKGIDRKVLYELQQVALDGERKVLEHQIAKGTVSEEIIKIYDFYFKEKNRRGITSRVRQFWIHMKYILFGHNLRLLAEDQLLRKKKNREDFVLIDNAVAQGALDALKAHETIDNRKECLTVSNYYTRRMSVIASKITETPEFKEEVKGMKVKGIQYERQEVSRLLQLGELTPRIAFELRQLISYDEMLLLDESDT